MAVPYTFGSATTSIPLSQLDSNFATAITLGNTAVQLGNTITTLTGVTNLASSGALTLGSNGNTTAVTIDTSQNVGIGTTPYATGLVLYRSTAGLLYNDMNNPSSANASDGVITRLITQNVASSGTTSVDLVKYKSGQFTINNNETNAAAFTSFGVGSSERMRLNSTGALVLAGGSTSANGIGIAFPATQSASTDANTLDDYEEGTWTPDVGGTATYTARTGQYVKIGRQVTVFFDLTINVIGTGTPANINGLPFVCSATSTGQGGIPTYWASLTASAVYMAIRVDNGGSQIVIAGSTAATATLSASFNCLGSGSRMIGTMTYTSA